MPDEKEEIAALKKLVSELSRRLDTVEQSLEAFRARTNQLSSAHTAHATSLGSLQTSLANTKADFTAAIAAEKEALTEAKRDLSEDLNFQRALAETRDKDALLLANLALFYGIMAQEWRIARDRVVTVTSSSTALQTLSRVGSYSLVLLLSTAVGAGASIAGAALARLIDGPLVSLAGKLGYDEATAREAMDAEGAEAMKEGFAHALTGVVMFLGHQSKNAAAGVTDPLEFFLDLEVQLRGFAVELAQTHKGQGAWSRSEVKNPLAATGTKATAASGLVGFAKDANIDTVASDPFWSFVLSATAKDHKERWAVVRSLVAVAMRRLAWSLYCRSQWRNLTWDYTVKVNAGLEYLEAPGAAFDWDAAPVEEWPHKAWASNMGWPAHFVEKIVPDFAGWEHDESHPIHERGTAVERARAETLHKRIAHFSLAVYMCCQIRPARGKDAIDPMAGAARAYLAKAMRGDDLPALVNFRAMRAEVNIVEVRFGSGSWGSATGKKGRMTNPTTFDKPYTLAVNPSTITVHVTSSGRTSRKAHIRLLGPFAQRPDPAELVKASPQGVDVVKKSTESLRLTATGTNDWRVTLASGSVYCVVLEERATVAEQGRAVYSADAWFFKTG
jgi:hypothetical protein